MDSYFGSFYSKQYGRVEADLRTFQKSWTYEFWSNWEDKERKSSVTDYVFRKTGNTHVLDPSRRLGKPATRTKQTNVNYLSLSDTKKNIGSRLAPAFQNFDHRNDSHQEK
jgi:hypothetical protein